MEVPIKHAQKWSRNKLLLLKGLFARSSTWKNPPNFTNILRYNVTLTNHVIANDVVTQNVVDVCDVLREQRAPLKGLYARRSTWNYPPTFRNILCNNVIYYDVIG